MNDVSERYFKNDRKETAVPTETLSTHGGVILDDVVHFVRRFVVLSENQADALALWIAHTHAFEAADATPYLTVTSAEKRSGKTRLLEVAELLVREPLPTANISDAALFRAIEAKTPTLLLDEVDAIFGNKAREREELRGLLNAGYRRGALAQRMGGSRMSELQTFRVFCPKAFAGIGDCLPDTITDRAIALRLERKTREERVERFRRREVVPAAEELRDRLADWLEPQLEELRNGWPSLPEELDDRAHDVWEPLFAIADLAGEAWPERARRVAVALSGKGAREDESLTARLLRDVHSVFDASEQFADAWHRVLGVTSVTSVTSQSPSQAECDARDACDASPTGDRLDALFGPSRNGTPRLGEDGFLEFLTAAVEANHITPDEYLERQGLHYLLSSSQMRQQEEFPF